VIHLQLISLAGVKFDDDVYEVLLPTLEGEIGVLIEVVNNDLRVLVDDADHAEDINEAEAEAAHERALQLKREAKDQVSLEHAQALVDRTATRLQVASLKHRKKRS
jgi:F0F1-type ATP synthase epsilon subunit